MNGWRHPGVIDVNSDQARQRAEKGFKKEERAQHARLAMILLFAKGPHV
jgi:hypothetical protein